MVLIALAWRNALLACCLSTSFALWEENLPGYLDVFAFGILSVYAYVRFGDWMRASPARRTGAIVVAILGIAYALSLLHGMYDFRTINQWSGVWQVNRRPLFGLAFAAMTLGSLAAPPLWRRLIANRILMFMGAISYNLYLYNQIVGRELLWHHLPTWVGKDPHFDPHWQLPYMIVASGASMAVATQLTFGFEQPILRAGARFLRMQKKESRAKTARLFT